ncbi:hypothetical protein DFH07DRAFT_1002692 [Mycena maculata]|uniref:Saccharopine dehydrogenase n=1 Tax=Mycena maculata TaxID=230809 RepID=A0AAD7MNK8_9AGAR|nr:hypothetical protein DFH07DRAFT_1002692 [Mycena maculata]
MVEGVKALVIGALGRDDIIKWDMAETAKVGPFSEILDVDIFVNCIYLKSTIPAFITRETRLLQQGRRESWQSSWTSAATRRTHSIYKINTRFSEPTVAVDVGAQNPPLSVISIDQLPTLLPREASEQFSMDLLPSLLKFPNRYTAPVWIDAEKLFKEKSAAVAAAVEGI